MEQRLTLPDSTRPRGIHATSWNDDRGIDLHLSDEALAFPVAGCDADLGCVWHTDWPWNRRAV